MTLHHYVSRCYLRSFAVQRTKKSYQTTVFDARTRKVFPTNIFKVAAVHDFNRVDADGHPPDAFEKGMAEFEGELGPAIERVKVAGTIDDENDRALILNFMCLLSLRNPQQREIARSFQERVAKQTMKLVLATPERWESQMRKARAAGDITKNEATYEQMKRFVDEGRYSLHTSTNHHLKREVSSFDKLLPCFFARRWTVLNAPPMSGGFVTSDHPVCLLWSRPTPTHRPPGHALEGTEVVFPLSPRLALIGVYEGGGGEVKVTDDQIAIVNGIIAAHAEWHVYARDTNFHFVSEDGQQPRKASKLIYDAIFKRPRNDRIVGNRDERYVLIEGPRIDGPSFSPSVKKASK